MTSRTLTLEMGDIFQILEALEAKAESWERTAKWLHKEENAEMGQAVVWDFDGEYYIIEECSHYEEAESIAEHYRNIIATINKQLDT